VRPGRVNIEGMAVTTRSPHGCDDTLGRETWIVGGVVIVGVVMSILDTTIVNVALDALSRELHAPLSTIQWVSTGYLLALAVVIPLSGWLSERFGAKRVWLVSVGLFGTGSALCGLAASAEMLIAFRVLQGLGGGMIMPVGMSLLAQTAGPRRVGRVMAVVGVPMLLGPVLGPVIGGLILDSVSWRWIFYVNVPVAVAALCLGARRLHAGSGRADAGRLDWPGLALLSPGLAGIIFGLSETETRGGITDPVAFGPIAGGVVLVALFARHALATERPLIDVRLMRGRAFGAAAATTFMIGAGLFGAMLVLPLYYQVARGQTALTAGLLMAPQGVGAALAMPFAGRMADRVGGGRVAVVGCAIFTLATLPLAAVAPTTSLALVAGLLVVRGVGMGAAMMPTMAAAYATLQSAQIPRATAVLNALQRIGGSIGTAVLAVVLQHEMRAVPAGAGHPSALLAPHSGKAGGQLAGPLATAFGHTFLCAAALSAVGLMPAILLAKAERSAGRDARRSARPDRARTSPAPDAQP